MASISSASSRKSPGRIERKPSHSSQKTA
jgi:hypothetical protein